MKNTSRLLILALAISLPLRVLFLGSREIWYDDAFSILLSRQSLAEIVSGTAADTMPPLYYFLLHFWMAVSQNLAWIRLMNVLLSLAVVGMLYAVVASLHGRQAGLWAAFLAAISPFQIYHAQEVRMYALLALALLAYVWFFIQVLQGSENRLVSWVGLVICGAAALYTHNLAAFTLLVPNLYVLARREWRLFWRLLAAQAVMGLLFLPWLLLVPGQISKIQAAFWTPRPGLVELVQALVQFTSSLPLPGLWMFVAVLLSFQILAIVLIEGLRKAERSSGMGLLALFALAPPVLLFAASYLMRPVFVPRGMILSSLAYYGIAGTIIARTWKKGIGILLAVLFSIAALFSLPFQYGANEFPRSPFLQASAYLNIVSKPGSQVVHDNKLSYFPMHYYAPELPQRFVADEPGSHNDTLARHTQSALHLQAEPNLEQAVEGSPTVYFVVFTRAIEEYRQQGLSNHPGLAWLEDRYQLLERQAFGDIEVYTFELR